MKTPLLLFSLLSFSLFQKQASAQSATQPPQNFPTAFAGVEANGSSGVVGMEYERLISAKGQAQLSVSGTYIFRYNVGGLNFLGDENPESRSVGMLMGKGTLFTSKSKKQTGFYLNAGLGLGLTHRQHFEATANEVHAVGDLGLGWHIPFDAGTGMRIGPSLLFASEGGIVRLKVAFGF
jgi:hypothetical protein